jgi:hypothetical protein
MLTRFCFLLLSSFIVVTVFSQKVTVASSRQFQNNIIVSYHLETASTCKISLYVSTDGGRIWTGPLKKVKGDVGNKVFGGDYSIEWSVLEEYNELIGDNIKFQVRAESNDSDFGTVRIGNQVWSTFNLDVSTYRNGDKIPEVSDSKKWANLTTGAWCWYNNDPSNDTKYGKLYNWYAVNDPRGLAPEGYHIPSYEEWTLFLSNYNVTKSIDFSKLLGGIRYKDGVFVNNLQYGYMWSSTEFDTKDALYLVWGIKGVLNRSNSFKNVGFSVLCIKD